MVCFQTKYPNLGKIWRALEWKMLVYFMLIWNILRLFGNAVLWYIFGLLRQEKYGNPEARGRFFKILGQSELRHNLFTTVEMPSLEL
jgi:hypothetical protein